MRAAPIRSLVTIVAITVPMAIAVADTATLKPMVFRSSSPTNGLERITMTSEKGTSDARTPR